MASIDERVVHMKFDNAQFEAGARQTIATLGALNKSLKLESATKGFHDVNAAAGKVSFNNLEAGVASIAEKFKAMSLIGITALNNIVNRAVDAGISIVKSLTVDPIKTGLSEYETNLNSIQTILSNTQAAGTTLADVNAALQELNLYSDQTIYNFAEMARNIGTFTAAGVALKPATAAIKGIANLAALSGSNSMQASTAMYQLSQAISAGRVSLMDWNSVVNAGMGGTVFQRALAQTAVAMGKLNESAVKLDGEMKNVTINGEAFRQSISAENGESWLTSDVLTNTLAQFTGDLSEAELAAQGFNAAQIAAIQQTAKTAKAAATEVKTLTQTLGALREGAGSGWAQTWQLIFGNFEEAKDLWSGVYNVISGMIEETSKSRNELLGDWKELGGRTALIEALSQAFNVLMEIVTPIRKAFRDIFPPMTGKQLYDLTILIRDIFTNMKLGEDTMNNLRRTFAGLFALLAIGKDVLEQVVRTIFRLFNVAFEGSGGFLEFTANIGDFLVGMRKSIKEGTGLISFFDKLGGVLEIPVKLIRSLGAFFGTLFGDFNGSAAADSLSSFVSNLDPIERMADAIAAAWKSVVSTFDDVWGIFEPLASRFASFFQEFGAGIASITGGLNFQDFLGAINTGALVTLVGLFAKFFGGDGKGGMLENVKDSIEQLTDTLGAMQHALQAATLLQIALAIGILTVSISVLSKIDSEGLAVAMSAIAVMFVQLLAALAVLEQMPGNNVAKLYAMATSMAVLGVAIGILAISVKSLSELSWEEMAKGLTGVTVLLGGLVAAVRLMPESGLLISTGIALLILAAGVKVLASAVSDLSGLNWEEMAKGLVGVGGILAGLTLFTRFAAANTGGVLQGAGIILLATGIKILASAIKDISVISWENIGKGMAVLATSLTLIAAALILIPPSSLFSAAGVLIVAASLGLIADALAVMGGMSWADIGAGLTVLAAALVLITAALIAIPPTALLSAAGVLVVAMSLGMIAEALAIMGDMSWDEIGRGLTVLAASLLIISVALVAMQSSILGAAALVIVAGALTVLAAVLKTLGGMTWDEILRGLVALAAAFLVLGVAGALMTSVVPTLLGLGAAVALLGLGLALAGVGVLAFSAGLTALSISGAAGAAALVAIVSSIIGLIPMLIEQIGIALILLIEIIAVAAPRIVTAVIDIVIAILKGIEDLAPQLVSTLLVLLGLLLDVLILAVPRMVEAGYKILVGVLTGIKNNIRKVVTLAYEIIAEFLKGVGDGLPKVIQAGVEMIIKFVEGLSKAIRENSERLGRAGADLALAIIEGMTRGLLAGGTKIRNAAMDVAKKALQGAMNILGINSPSKEFEKLGIFSSEGMVLGLERSAGMVSEAAGNVGNGALRAMSKSLSGISSAINAEIDIEPTISPVLDLTNVRKDASQIERLMAVKPITTRAAYTSASDISASYQARQVAAQEADEIPQSQSQSPTLTYNQYNTSPKALSTADIYRQTKNQLSTAKGVLP